MITADAPVAYENRSKELVSSGAAKVSTSNKNIANLKALKENQPAIKNAVVLTSYDREYLSTSEKAEYDSLSSDASRKKWFNSKKREDKKNQAEALEAWRADPDSVYDRVSIPSEHKVLLEDENTDDEYVRAIGCMTDDPRIRNQAVKTLMERQELTKEQAEVSIPRSSAVLMAEYEKDMARSNAKSYKPVVAEPTNETVTEAEPTNEVATESKTNWYGGKKKTKLTKADKEKIKADFDAKQLKAKQKASTKGATTSNGKKSKKAEVELNWYGRVKKPKLSESQKEELRLKQAATQYEAKLKQKAINKTKRRKEVKNFFLDFWRS